MSKDDAGSSIALPPHRPHRDIAVTQSRVTEPAPALPVVVADDEARCARNSRVPLPFRIPHA